MIVIIVTSHVRPEKLDAFLEAAREVRTLVLAEPGCLGYEHFVDWQSPLKSQRPVDPTRVVLIEKWESPEHLAAHGQAPHGKIFAENVRSWREGVAVEALRPAY